MGFYLEIKIESTFPPEEFQERVLRPLGEALDREALGHILEPMPEDDPAAEGVYVLALEVTDPERARQLVDQVVASAVD
jgi:hypothetical protein